MPHEAVALERYPSAVPRERRQLESMAFDLASSNDVPANARQNPREALGWVDARQAQSTRVVEWGQRAAHGSAEVNR
jgi:hypothetical protein